MVVVVALLFYVHGKHLKVMSGRSVNLTTLFLGRLRPPKRLTRLLHAHTFASNLQLPFLKKWKEKRKYVARLGIKPGTPDIPVRCPTDCATRPSSMYGGKEAGFALILSEVRCCFAHKMKMINYSCPCTGAFCICQEIGFLYGYSYYHFQFLPFLWVAESEAINITFLVFGE